jgi:hypothetical protein
MRLTLLLIISLWSVSSLAQKAIVTLRSTVTGNQEQPKVMYIVPWQPPGTMDFRYSPISRLAEDLFTQIDRDEFRRELDYRALLAEPDADMTDGEQSKVFTHNHRYRRKHKHKHTVITGG